MAVHRERAMNLCFVCVYMLKRSDLYTGFSGAGVFDDFGSNLVERTGDRGEFHAGRMEDFLLCETMSKRIKGGEMDLPASVT